MQGATGLADKKGRDTAEARLLYSLVLKNRGFTVLWDLLGNGEEKSDEIGNPDHFCSTGPVRKVLWFVTVTLFFGKEP